MSKASPNETEIIETLSKLLEIATSRQTPKADTGACVYTAGEKTYCATLSESDCDTLGGAWTKNGKCP